MFAYNFGNLCIVYESKMSHTMVALLFFVHIPVEVGQ